MKHKLKYLAALLALTVTPWIGIADSLAQVATGTANNTGPQTGMQVATQGTANGVAACASCHGAKGEGNAAAGFPRLAGQAAAYLERQLAGYANGTRRNPVMEPIAKALSQQQAAAVSRYYASLETPAPAVTSTGTSEVASPSATAAAPAGPDRQRGRLLAETGDERIGVQSCANCHGPGGEGMGTPNPYLAGQPSSYLKAALGAWKSGARNTDPSRNMPLIAHRLSDEDIAALAAYYAAQPAPSPERFLTNVPSGSIAKPATAPASSPTRSGVTATKGIGVEQGEPTSGGAQGPGGGGTASGSGSSGSN